MNERPTPTHVSVCVGYDPGDNGYSISCFFFFFAECTNIIDYVVVVE